VKIRLNGADRETASGTVAGLIDELGLPRQAVLIERNGQPLDRSHWDSAPLEEGDSLEVLRISAGG
jgi:thiamine biosynthesis protein ThiS